jgi:hypothetical protein
MLLGLTILMFFVALGAGQVSIISPRDGEIVRSHWLTVKVEKPTEEGHVSIWLDGEFVVAITAPFEFRIDLLERKVYSGTHTIKVVGFNRLGQKEGETQVQFRVDLKSAKDESAWFIFKPKTGELVFYTFQAVSETIVDVPAKARKDKFLNTKLTLRWFQTIRDITVDRQFRMMRIIEDGLLEHEVRTPKSLALLGTSISMGSLTGGMGQPGMYQAGMYYYGGEETSGGMLGPMGPAGQLGQLGMMGPTGMAGQLGMMGPMGMVGSTGVTVTPVSLLRLRLRPTEDERVGLFTLLHNGSIVSGEEIPSVVKFASGSVDLAFPDRELKIGENWEGFITLPKNPGNLLDNLTILPPSGMPRVGGLLTGEEFTGEEFSGMGGPVTPSGFPTQPVIPPMPGIPGAPGVPGFPFPSEPEALLADATVVTVPANHRFDGFESWSEKICVRIVSEFKVDIELTPTNIQSQMPTQMGAGQMGMAPGGIYGGPTPGGQITPITPRGFGAPGVMVGAPPAGPGGQAFPIQRLKGTADGTRILLFDIENGQVVYVKVTLKATFDADLATVSQLAQLFSAPSISAAPGGSAPYGEPSGGEFAPPYGIPSFGGYGAPAPGPFGGYGAPAPGPFGGYGTPALGPFGGTGIYESVGPTTLGGFGALGMPSIPGIPQQPILGMQPQTIRNYPAKLLYSLTVENTLSYSGRLDQLLKELSSGQ